jgi:aspartyl aminopeptidase
MIGAYGHDDRVCAYPAMMAVLESEDPETTSLCILTDKEEIGSVGNTGAQSRAMENFLADLCAMSSTAIYTDRALRRCLDRSKMLSADVTAAVDPNYEGTHDKLNASYLGKGLAIMKYSGAAANPALPTHMRNMWRKSVAFSTRPVFPGRPQSSARWTRGAEAPSR